MKKIWKFLCSLVVDLLKAVRDVIEGKVPPVKGIRRALGSLAALAVGIALGIALFAPLNHFASESIVSVVGKGKAAISQTEKHPSAAPKAKGGVAKPQSPCSPQEPATVLLASPSFWPSQLRAQ